MTYFNNKKKQYRNPYFSKAPRVNTKAKENEEYKKSMQELENQLKENAAPITSFVNRVKSVKPLPKEEKYQNGWTYMTKKNGIITRYDHNVSTYNFEDEKTPDEIMFNAIQRMRINWLNYQINYDEIHGDGAYEEHHQFENPIIYDSESESEDESEESEED